VTAAAETGPSRGLMVRPYRPIAPRIGTSLIAPIVPKPNASDSV